jgi:hypothetical protein
MNSNNPCFFVCWQQAMVPSKRLSWPPRPHRWPPPLRPRGTEPPLFTPARAPGITTTGRPTRPSTRLPSRDQHIRQTALEVSTCWQIIQKMRFLLLFGLYSCFISDHLSPSQWSIDMHLKNFVHSFAMLLDGIISSPMNT